MAKNVFLKAGQVQTLEILLEEQIASLKEMIMEDDLGLTEQYAAKINFLEDIVIQLQDAPEFELKSST